VKYYIIAGERSGDLHGGNLVKSLLRYDASAHLRGFGGEEMQAAGVQISVHYRELAFMGFVSLITSLFKIFKFISICKKDILDFKPDAVILIDYGGFNMKMAKFVKEQNIPVLYYIPPKVWAWYQSRARKLKANVDRMFVILPFETEFYKKYDLQVDYVGNPVLDAIKNFQPNPEFIIEHRISTDRKLVALLPGSRKIELKLIVPLMAELADANPEVQFVVAAVSNLPSDLYSVLKNKPNVKFVEGETYNLLSHAHAAIVTSGTATLETAIFKVPQVVVYKTNALEYFIASSLVKVKFISLVNLIAGKEVIREMIQKQANKNVIQVELNKLLNDQSYVSAIRNDYENLYRALDTGSASDNAAKRISEHVAPRKP
jgi:lipid-A-disaccharide synthase